jgi:serine/threonine-protein kinase
MQPDPRGKASSPRPIDQLSETLEAMLSSPGLDGLTIEQRARETIVPADLRIDTAAERSISLLEELGATTLDRKLELRGTIGEGGMGIVRLARQRSLGREVAVKTLKPDFKSERAVLKLLREAWVTGGLEHPNVVPVYDVALDADGAPLIVLKKIEGIDWSALMHDAEAVYARFGATDPLEWNLRILMQVCNAVRYAHSRGVVHRDIKPDNVMIGAFGEVYLADWGIAVSSRDDGTGRLPLASEALELAGTPNYMAPEMLGGARESRVGPHSDVYLLGAVLYEILTGRPPHRGESLMAIVGSIVASEPELPLDAPAELAAVVRRAMSPESSARFESAEQVRLAVEAFLRHRDASRLAERAREKLEELRGALAAGIGSEPEDREALYQLFGQCRFGFRHALEVWPENAQAREGFDRAVLAMVEHELALGEPWAARALLADLAEVPAELGARVAEAIAAKEQDEARRRQLEEDLDPAKGRRTRSFVGIVMGVLWTALPLLGQLEMQRTGREPSVLVGIAASAAQLILMAGLGYWARDSLTRTAINRRISLAVLGALTLQLVARSLAALTGESFLAVFHDQLLVWCAIAFMLAVSVDWRLLFSAVGFLLGYLLLPVIGISYALYVVSAVSAVLLVNVAVLWTRPTEDVAIARDRMRERRAERHRQWAELRERLHRSRREG